MDYVVCSSRPPGPRRPGTGWTGVAGPPAGPGQRVGVTFKVERNGEGMGFGERLDGEAGGPVVLLVPRLPNVQNYVYQCTGSAGQSGQAGPRPALASREAQAGRSA